jgi:hypothetical protein
VQVAVQAVGRRRGMARIAPRDSDESPDLPP